MKRRVDIRREADGTSTAEIPAMPGTAAPGATPAEAQEKAVAKAEALELRGKAVATRVTHGRWMAEIPDVPGAVVYGATRVEAIDKVVGLALGLRRPRLHVRDVQRIGGYLRRRDLKAEFKGDLEAWLLFLRGYSRRGQPIPPQVVENIICFLEQHVSPRLGRPTLTYRQKFNNALRWMAISTRVRS